MEQGAATSILHGVARYALVTGATQGLGLALAEALANRLNAQDTVYLTGRNPDRVAQAVESLPAGGARVLGEVAATALYLAGDQSSFTTGSELFVDGGATQL